MHVLLLYSYLSVYLSLLSPEVTLFLSSFTLSSYHRLDKRVQSTTQL